jgi:glycosyltransferase involved in cell wall biosynthesis
MVESRVCVAFTKDWDDVPTCTTHILRRMGLTESVLWVNSIGMRKPSLGGGRDWRRIWRRIAGGVRRAEWKENKLSVLTPVLVPKAESRTARWVNRHLMRWQLEREAGKCGVGGAEYWCFVPNAGDVLPLDMRRADRGSRIIYYCVDDWSEFKQYDTAWLAQKERELLARADVVFTPSRYLQEKCRRVVSELQGCRVAGLQGGGDQLSVVGRQVAPPPPAPEVHYMPHGVEHGKFAAALKGETVVPGDVADLAGTVVGFYGNLYPWVDFSLIERLAEARPTWSFVLIGHAYCDVSGLQRHANVHLLGRREHDMLPAYCKAFDAAMIPYRMDDPRMQSVNPVKAKELLAAGVPIVAADIPEMRGYGADALLCRTTEEWLVALDEQVDRQDRAAISAKMRCEDWSEKVRQLRAIVDALP